MIGGVRGDSKIVAICAFSAIITTCIKVSALGRKLPMVITYLNGDHLIITLSESALLGMGVSPPIAYTLVATWIVPALKKMGMQ